MTKPNLEAIRAASDAAKKNLYTLTFWVHEGSSIGTVTEVIDELLVEVDRLNQEFQILFRAVENLASTTGHAAAAIAGARREILKEAAQVEDHDG